MLRFFKYFQLSSLRFDYIKSSTIIHMFKTFFISSKGFVNHLTDLIRLIRGASNMMWDSLNQAFSGKEGSITKDKLPSPYYNRYVI